MYVLNMVILGILVFVPMVWGMVIIDVTSRQVAFMWIKIFVWVIACPTGTRSLLPVVCSMFAVSSSTVGAVWERG